MNAIKFIIGSAIGAALAIAIAEESFGEPPPSPPAAAYDGNKVLEFAKKELGIFKAPGEDSQRVKQYCLETFQNDDVYVGDGWCSAFVAFILKEAGYQFSPNNTDFGWMYHCHRVSPPKPGDMAMLDSHIAFFLGFQDAPDGSRVAGLLGGNQDYQVCIMYIPAKLVEYYAEPETAGSEWKPEKHIPNSATAAGMNTFDDHLRFGSPSVHRTVDNHPL